MNRRKLVIDGAEWRYFVGKDAVKIWSPDERTTIVPCHEVVGVSSSDYERAKWKRTSNAAVTPGRVCACIDRIAAR